MLFDTNFSFLQLQFSKDISIGPKFWPMDLFSIGMEISGSKMYVQFDN